MAEHQHVGRYYVKGLESTDEQNMGFMSSWILWSCGLYMLMDSVFYVQNWTVRQIIEYINEGDNIRQGYMLGKQNKGAWGSEAGSQLQGVLRKCFS